DVLITPAPQATLVCVGKRSQRIELRAWIEEGREPGSYRDELLRLVSKYLRDEKLFASNQPTQPPMNEHRDSDLHDSHRSRRKRSA
ncbi:MAG: mechanosensitive ion channel protein MscS, partial [Rubripirellula sp.]